MLNEILLWVLYQYTLLIATNKIYLATIRSPETKNQGRVVLSIVSLTSSLRGQLVKYFTTLKPNTLIVLLKKMREAFAM